MSTASKVSGRRGRCALVPTRKNASGRTDEKKKPKETSRRTENIIVEERTNERTKRAHADLLC